MRGERYAWRGSAHGGERYASQRCDWQMCRRRLGAAWQWPAAPPRCDAPGRSAGVVAWGLGGVGGWAGRRPGQMCLALGRLAVPARGVAGQMCTTPSGGRGWRRAGWWQMCPGLCTACLDRCVRTHLLPAGVWPCRGAAATHRTLARRIGARCGPVSAVTFFGSGMTGFG